MFKTKIVHFAVAVIFINLLLVTDVQAEFQPSADQLKMFSQLSPADQEKALRAIANSPSTSTFSEKNVPGQLSEPQVVTPRAVESDKKLELQLQQGSDVPSLDESKKTKAVEEPLKQFGYDLFAGTPTTFAPATDIPIPTEYIVGPGDNVQIQLFGKENADYDLVVSREGKLRFPGIGPISVAGLRFDELKNSLQKRIKRQMIGVNANITMGTLRSIRVFVLGDVIRPGSYTISALSNMTNALFVSGGIKPIGSLRSIQLKRAGKVITTLDLYDLLLRGDTSNDRRLQPGDVIFVPPIAATVGVAGEVKRPAIYELKGTQTIADALNFSGGLLATAYPKLTQLERITASGEKTLIDVDATNAAQLEKSLHDGDVVRVYSVLEKMQDIVITKGHIHRPGGTQWFSGMRLTDVISSVDDLLPKPDLGYVVIRREIAPERYIEVLTTRLDRALEDHKAAENLLLKPRDEIYFFGLGEKREQLIAPLVEQLKQQERYGHPARIVSVKGNVYYPGTYPYSENMYLSDAIRASYDVLPLTDIDYALLARRVDDEGKIAVLAVNLGKALRQPHGPDDAILNRRDEIYVFNVAEYKKDELEDLKAHTPDNVVSQKIAQAVRDGAVDDVAEKLSRNRQELLRPLIQQLKEQTHFGEFAPVVSVSGLVKAPGEYPLVKDMQLNDLIRLAGNLTESAYTLGAELTRYSIVKNEYREINHYDITQNQLLQNGINNNFALQPYDHLIIKRIPQWTTQLTVNLKGEFKFPGEYTFRRGETLSEVIKRAGGLSQFAFPEGAVFMRKELREREQKNIDDLAAKLESDLTAMSLENAQGNTGKSPAEANSMAIAKSLLNQLKSTRAVGRLVIDLKSVIANGDSDDDSDVVNDNRIVLKDGDELIVPTKTQEVTIIGEVQQSTSHMYREDLGRDDYINLSGGMTYKADEDRIYIVRANGAVVSDESVGWFGNSQFVYPGDTIVVPLDADRMKPLTFWTSITQIIYQLGVSAAAWKTVGLF